jgi:hypothetical protein
MSAEDGNIDYKLGDQLYRGQSTFRSTRQMESPKDQKRICTEPMEHNIGVSPTRHSEELRVCSRGTETEMTVSEGMK